MTATLRPIMVVDEVEVVGVERLSPSFVRILLGGPAVADVGTAGPTFDQRIKLLVPGPSGRLPRLAGDDGSWYAAWLDLPEGERGHLRTYTVRELRGQGLDTHLVVDVVLHPGPQGPGATWAAAAAPGDRVVLVGPRRGQPSGGIEFDPGGASRLLLVGDETAVPAVGGILAGVGSDAAGAVILEVPEARDVLDLPRVPGVGVTWLPRHGAPYGSRLVPAVLGHLGLAPGAATGLAPEVDPHLWETPSYSSSGESLALVRAEVADLYAWVAGEASVVTRVRRALVGDAGLDRRQVAFMGYWRQGVAMRS